MNQTMLERHRKSILWLIVAVLIYGVLGVLLPEFLLSKPATDTEVGWQASRAAGALLKTIMPYAAALVAIVAVVAFIRELRS